MRAALIALAAVCAAAAPAFATPLDDFDRANQLFRARDYPSASRLLAGVLYPQPQLGDANQVFEAHVLLGACAFEMDDKPSAHDEFEKALAIDPDRALTPLSYSPGAIDEFESTKIEVHQRNAAEAARKLKADANNKLQAYLKSLVVVEQHSYLQNFAPLGGGQFQNHETKKFVAIAVGEIVTAGTSIGIFGYLVNKYGISGTVDPTLDDPHTVRRLQQVEIGTGIAFFGIYAYGILDSILHYQRSTRIQTDPTLLPPDLRSLDPDAPQPLPAAPPAKPKTSFHLGPILVPSGAGIGLAWER